ncbi:hypothetical protein ACEPAI_8212 [Sanghuangporus weigelae]
MAASVSGALSVLPSRDASSFINSIMAEAPGASDSVQAVQEGLALIEEEEDTWALDGLGLQEKIKEIFKDFQVVDGSAEGQFASEMVKGHITDNTLKGHIRIISNYIAYHRKRNCNWNPTAVTATTPHDIVLFLTFKCGPKDQGFQGNKYATAVSTRAAITYWYLLLNPNADRVGWNVNGEICHGLPTRSLMVARFMQGLQRRQAKQGDVSASACAITYQDMKCLHWICISKPGLSDSAVRSGSIRYCVYLFAWLLLERLNETLSLDFTNIDFSTMGHFTVTLNTRKNMQSGGCQRMRLYANDAEPVICPVRALLRIVGVYKYSADPLGPLFLTVNSKGQLDPNKRLTPQNLYTVMQKDLQDLLYKRWSSYSTHSFRRGGCQFRLKERGWSPDMVAAWGGWSQQEAITMYRYFYSPEDNHDFVEDYDKIGMPSGKRMRTN